METSIKNVQYLRWDVTHQLYDIQGVAHLDYFDLYRKFTYTAQESYRLDHIAFVELGERKDGNPYETFQRLVYKRLSVIH